MSNSLYLIDELPQLSTRIFILSYAFLAAIAWLEVTAIIL